MKSRTIQRTAWLWLWVFVQSFVSGVCLAQDRVQTARDVTQAFLQAEFDGDVLPKREKLIIFSSKRLAEFEHDEPGPGPGPYVLYRASRPVFIVGAYEIVDVKTKDHRATAVVSYRKLARLDNIGTSEVAIKPDRQDRELVTLNLVFEKNQWWVLDPPPPRVSKQVLIAYYEDKVKEDAPIWEQNLNDPAFDEEQKANVRANRDQATGTLRVLKNLP